MFLFFVVVLTSHLTVLEVLLSHFLCRMLHQQCDGASLIFGRPNEFVTSLREKLLAWLAMIQTHAHVREDATMAFLQLCRNEPGLSFTWGGLHIAWNEPESIVSNAYFERGNRKLFLSLFNAGEFEVNHISLRWTLSEMVGSVAATLNAKKE